MESNKVTASKLTIENLPDDVLLEIFKYLNKGAIKESSRVCHRWHDLILGSKVLTERITLFFNTDDRLYPLDELQEKFSDLILESKEFPYRNFAMNINQHQPIETLTEIQDKFLQIIKNPLKLELAAVPMPLKLNALQASASTLTHLCLKHGCSRELTFDLPLEFPNLVSLHLWDHVIPVSLVAPKLKELDFKPSFPYHRDNLEIFSQFLCKFEGLKKLTTFAVPIIDGKAIKLQLEELCLSSYVLQLEPLKAFLMTQKKSLKIFKMDNSYLKVPQNLINFIIQHLRLEELAIRSKFDDTCQPEEIKDINYSIKKLHLNISSDRHDFTTKFVIPILKKICGVESLDLRSIRDLDLVFKEIDMSNLKELSLKFLDNSSFDSFEFAQFKLEKLTRLKIYSISRRKAVSNLVKITSFCPNLKILNIVFWTPDYSENDKFIELNFQKLFKFSPNLEDFVFTKCHFLHKSFIIFIQSVKSKLLRLKVGFTDERPIPDTLKKMQNAKFLCDFHCYDKIGMRQVEWNHNEYRMVYISSSFDEYY